MGPDNIILTACRMKEELLLSELRNDIVDDEFMYCDEDGNYLAKACYSYDKCMCLDRDGNHVDGATFPIGQFECDYDSGYVCPEDLVYQSCRVPDRYCGLLEYPASDMACAAGCGCPDYAPFVNISGQCVAEADCDPVEPFEIIINRTFSNMGRAMVSSAVDQSTCVDKNPTCKDWAARDLCDNPYLIKNCWKSCKLCLESEVALDCAGVRNALVEEQARTGSLGVPDVVCLAEQEDQYFPRQCLGSVCFCVNGEGAADTSLTHGIGHHYQCPGSDDCPAGQHYLACSFHQSCEQPATYTCEQGCGCPGSHPVYNEEEGYCMERQECEHQISVSINPGKPCYEAVLEASADFFPLCLLDEDGTDSEHYEARQCGLDGKCYCVSAEGTIEEEYEDYDYICRRLQDECTGGKEYTNCGTACPDTCDNMFEIRACTLQCVFECQCPHGTVDHNGTCVAPDQCPGFADRLPTNCQQKAEMYERFGMNMPGAPIPACDNAGNFEHEQCVGSECYCVDSETGAEVETSRHAIGTPFNCFAFVMNSQCEGGKEFNMCGTACPDTCDNMFTMRACTKQCVLECQCPRGSVEQDGVCVSASECPDFLQRLPVNCQEREDAYRRIGLDKPGAPIPVCDPDGNYEYEQCRGSECYCVESETGVELEGTRHAIGEKFNCFAFVMNSQCEGGKEFNMCGTACPDTCDNMFTMRACTMQCVLECQCPYGTVDQEGTCVVADQCPGFQERLPVNCQDKNDAFYHLGLEKPDGNECDSDGNYEYGQCQGSECYCVESETGAEVDGSRHSSTSEFMLNCFAFVMNSKCEGGKEFALCGTDCPDTCDNMFAVRATCTTQCVVECQCPYGTVDQNGTCVVADQCPDFQEMIPVNCQDKNDAFSYVGLEMPDGNECDSDGNYYYEQCSGAECWCVYPETGEELEGSRHDSIDLDCEQLVMDSQCVGDMSYKPCGKACNVTCLDQQPLCDRMCTPRCSCPEESPVYDEEAMRCHSVEECPTEEPAATTPQPTEGPAATTSQGPDNIVLQDQECGEDMVFNNCGSFCNASTCDDREPACDNFMIGHDETVLSVNFDYECNPRCECLEYYHLHEGVCIPEKMCPITDWVESVQHGAFLPYQEGEVLWIRTNSELGSGEEMRFTFYSEADGEAVGGIKIRFTDPPKYLISRCASTWTSFELPDAAGNRTWSFREGVHGPGVTIDCDGEEIFDFDFHDAEKAGKCERGWAGVATVVKFWPSDTASDAYRTAGPLEETPCRLQEADGLICDVDGGFLATQCRGEADNSTCLCVNEEGRPIPMSEHEPAEFQDMDYCEYRRSMAHSGPCSYARNSHAVHDQTAMYGSPGPNCEVDGKFSRVQCTGSVCACYDEYGGRVSDEEFGQDEYATADERCLELLLERRFSHPCLQDLAVADGLTDRMSIGHFQPICDRDGHYSPTQCLGSMCYCANRFTGQEMTNTSFDIGSNDDSFCEGHRHAYLSRDCSASLVEFYEAPLMMGRFRPNCTTDGFYASAQCHGSVCQCVEPHMGQHIPQTQHQIGTDYDCDGTLAAILSTECNTARQDAIQSGMFGAFTPECEVDGSYRPRQCDGSSCYCTDRSGIELSNSRHELPVDDDFVGSMLQVYDVASIDMCGKKRMVLESSDCYQEKQSAAEFPGGYSPNCDDEGRYEALQCEGSRCFCVDEGGRRMVPAESGSEGASMCEDLRELHANSLCYQMQRQAALGETYVCNATDGKFAPQQCVGVSCFCVDVEMGEVMNGTGHPVSDAGRCGTTDAPFVKCSAMSQDIAPGQSVAICDEEGMYFVQQCQGTECVCADKFGVQVPDSDHHIAEQLCLEEVRESLAAADTTRSDCEVARLVADSVEGIGGFRPACQDDGAFHARQCLGSVCFCVGQMDGRPKADSSHPIHQQRDCAEPRLHIRAPGPIAAGAGDVVGCAIAAGAPDNTLQMTINGVPSYELADDSHWGEAGFKRSIYDQGNGTILTVIVGYVTHFVVEQNNSLISCTSDLVDRNVERRIVLNGTVGPSPTTSGQPTTAPTVGESYHRIYNAKRGFVVAESATGLVVARAVDDDDTRSLFQHMPDGTIRSVAYPDTYLTQNLVTGAIIIQLKPYKGNAMQTWYRDVDSAGDGRLYVLRSTKKGQTNYYLDYFKQALAGYKATDKANQKWDFV